MASEPRNDYTVITGASSGIGRALSWSLARRGHALILIARDRARLESLSEELQQRYNVTAKIKAVDLADTDDLRALCDSLHRLSIRLLVNNAGIATATDFEHSPTSVQDEILATNFRAPRELCQSVLPGMLQRKRGGIINVASLSGVMPGDPDIGYAASKAALVSLTRSISIRFGSKIAVTLALPGFIHTEIHERAGIPAVNLPRHLWGTAETAAEEIVTAHEKGRSTVVTPRIYGPLLALYQLLPRRVGDAAVHHFHGRTM